MAPLLPLPPKQGMISRFTCLVLQKHVSTQSFLVGLKNIRVASPTETRLLLTAATCLTPGTVRPCQGKTAVIHSLVILSPLGPQLRRGGIVSRDKEGVNAWVCLLSHLSTSLYQDHREKTLYRRNHRASMPQPSKPHGTMLEGGPPTRQPFAKRLQ